MSKILRIGTRDSQLAVWQAAQVQNLLQEQYIKSELIFIKSEGDKDVITPLYALGVQGIFTKTLDAALLNNRIDIAVHSMKDVPTQLAQGIQQAAVLKRGNWKDIFVKRQSSRVNAALLSIDDPSIVNDNSRLTINDSPFTIHDSRLTIDDSPLTIHDSRFTVATSSTRRIAQWLHRYPNHTIKNLRGNVNTRLRKLNESNWNGAIFAAAGLERINLRPENSIDLEWMLPAPAQGAIMVVCRENDDEVLAACKTFNDEPTALCTKIEKDFLRELMGGCSTPIAALAEINNDEIIFKGNILSLDGKEKAEVNKIVFINETNELGKIAAKELLDNGGRKIAESMRDAKS